MLWNSNMSIDYDDYKMAMLQAAGWRIRSGTEIESVGFITYVATKSEHRVVMSFNENKDLIKLTGSINKKIGTATIVTPYNKEATDRFIKYFKAI